MADISDVENALAATLTSIVYPNGQSASSVFGCPVRIMRGLPTSNTLQQDRSDGRLDLSISAIPETARNTTRWGLQNYPVQSMPGIKVATVGNLASFSGVANAGDLIGMIADQVCSVYAATAGDTGSVVAKALAAELQPGILCGVIGSSVSVPAARRVVARAVGAGAIVQELGRQEENLRVGLWAASPALRDQVGRLITSALASVSFLTLLDGSSARLRFESDANIDADQGSSIYRRDIEYSTEFATTQVLSATCLLFGDINMNGTEYQAKTGGAP